MVVQEEALCEYHRPNPGTQTTAQIPKPKPRVPKPKPRDSEAPPKFRNPKPETWNPKLESLNKWWFKKKPSVNTTARIPKPKAHHHPNPEVVSGFGRWWHHHHPNLEPQSPRLGT
jgi:hypothetical protein